MFRYINAQVVIRNTVVDMVDCMYCYKVIDRYFHTSTELMYISLAAFVGQYRHFAGRAGSSQSTYHRGCG